MERNPGRFPGNDISLETVICSARIALGIAFFVVFTVAWAAALSGIVPIIFPADPLTMVQHGWTLIMKFGFTRDIGITVWRGGGFELAAIVAVPLEILMGAH